MANGIPITVVGNLVEDPELKFTSSGDALVNIRVASNKRVYDRNAGEWKNGNTTFIGGTAWRNLAENIAESLRKGDAVVVTGELEQRSYDTQAGERRHVMEIKIDTVGVSLARATAQVTRQSAENSGNKASAAASSNDAAASGSAWDTADSSGSSAEPPF